MDKRFLLVAVIVSVIVFLDQLTKSLIAENLELNQRVPVFDSFFDLTHMRNPGAAFSFLAQAPAWFRQPFFLTTTVIAICALLILLMRAREEGLLLFVATASILGGAIGNLIDRLYYGWVIDFLLLYWNDYYWPAFNVADSCITVGVIGLLWTSLRSSAAVPAR
jgi:signal peptidase II